MHTYNTRVYYEDTDAGGVVYYANYLRFCERARTEYLRDIGVDLAEFVRDSIHFVVTQVEAKYRRPALYGDLIDVRTTLTNVSRSSLTLYHELYRDTTLLVTSTTKMASIRATPTGPILIRIPPQILTLLKQNQ